MKKSPTKKEDKVMTLIKKVENCVHEWNDEKTSVLICMKCNVVKYL